MASGYSTSRVTKTPMSSGVHNLTTAACASTSRPIRNAVKFTDSRWNTTTVLRVQNANTHSGSAIILEMSTYDSIGKLKDNIAVKTKIPRHHQRLKIAGKPGLVTVDRNWILAYNAWGHKVLDMVLEIISGDFYVCSHFCSHIRWVKWEEVMMEEIHKEEIILKVNEYDTIKEIKKQILAKLDRKPSKDIQLLYSNSIQVAIDLANTNDYSRLQKENEYQELSEDPHSLKEYGVLLFHQLLKLRACFYRIEDDGVKHFYLVEVVDGLDTSHHNPDDYLLSLEYNTTVNKMYSMVADHYKVSVEHVVLMVNDYQIPADDMLLHKVLYCPIIMHEEKTIPYMAACLRVAHLVSKPDDCPNPRSCELAMKMEDDPIIKHIVTARNDSWVTFVIVFNISDETRKEIEENSDDDCIRCMDVMHRMYHHDVHLTWEFVEIQVRREDPQLADTIRAQLELE